MSGMDLLASLESEPEDWYLPAYTQGAFREPVCAERIQALTVQRDAQQVCRISLSTYFVLMIVYMPDLSLSHVHRNSSSSS